MGHLDFDIVSTARCPAEDLELRISDFASLGIFTTVENPLQIALFMQNKANFPDALMNVSPVITREYKNYSNWTLGENKPNSNPIKANTKPIKANKMPKQTQNKPNQTQSNPISKAKKMLLRLPINGRLFDS